MALLTCGAVACGGGDEVPDAGPPQPDAFVANGTFSLAWTLSDGMGTVTCDQVKATGVKITLLPTSGAPGFTELGQCSSGMLTGSPHPVQSYNVTIELTNSAGQTMATVTQTDQSNVADTVTALPTAAFTTTRNGGVKFKIDVGTTSALNCPGEMDTPAGAGIDTLTVELRSGGTCVPAALAVTGEAMARAATCAAPSGACIENDKDIILAGDPGVPAGDYELVVTGLEGAEVCYTGNATFTISGGNVEKPLSPVIISLVDMMVNPNCVGP
jgi:hypothetical protein